MTRPAKGNLLAAVLWLLASSAVCALEVEGVWQQGATLIGRVSPAAEVSFAGRQLRTTADGRFVLGLGRDAGPEAVIRVRDPDGAPVEHRFAVKQRRYAIQRIEGVPRRTVNPPPEALARIRQEAALARQARTHDLPRRDFLQTFAWPLRGPVTGVYGSQRFYNGEPRRPHYGVDVAAPTGTRVQAPAAGKVTLAHADMYFSGGTLILDHGHGLSSTFIHLSKLLVREGQEISQGQAIAEVGATGRATGPHLDWRMNWFEFRLDPQLLVGEMPPG